MKILKRFPIRKWLPTFKRKSSYSKNMAENLFCSKSDLNNEDSVEKFFINRFIEKLGFEDKEIKSKKSIQELSISKGRKKENYKPDYVLYNGKKPAIVVEAKAINEDITDFEYQALGYAFCLNNK